MVTKGKAKPAKTTFNFQAPRMCRAEHPKYKGVYCVNTVFKQSDCLNYHRGMVGRSPNRRFIYFEAKEETNG